MLDLSTTLKIMNAMGMYRELVLYMEACYSGSMFEWGMPENMNSLC